MVRDLPGCGLGGLWFIGHVGPGVGGRGRRPWTPGRGAPGAESWAERTGLATTRPVYRAYRALRILSCVQIKLAEEQV